MYLPPTWVFSIQICWKFLDNKISLWKIIIIHSCNNYTQVYKMLTNKWFIFVAYHTPIFEIFCLYPKGPFVYWHQTRGYALLFWCPWESNTVTTHGDRGYSMLIPYASVNLGTMILWVIVTSLEVRSCRSLTVNPISSQINLNYQIRSIFIQ